MAESVAKRKIVLPPINLEEVKSSALVSSSPTSPVAALRKSSCVKYNCLCSPTTHAGSFRCRYHRNPGLTRSVMSVGSKLSEFATAGSKLSEIESKPPRICNELRAL